MKKKILSVILAVLFVSAIAATPAAAAPKFIESLEAEDFSVYEGMNGYYYDYYDEDGNFLGIRYYYDSEPMIIKVGYSDGTEEELHFYELQEAARYYAEIDDGQGPDLPGWGVGDHEVTLTADDVSTTYTVTVLPTPLVEMSVDDFSLYMGLDSQEIETNDGVTFTYFDYNLTINALMANGETYEFSPYYGGVPYEDMTARAFVYDDQSPDNEWGVGEHTVTVYFMGKTADVTITVLEDPISAVIFNDIRLTEDLDGIWYDNNYVYYQYAPSFTVFMNDGTVLESEDGHVQIGDRYFSGWSADSQDRMVWKAGEYKATGYFADLTDDFKITIDPNPYSKLEIENTAVDGKDCLRLTLTEEGKNYEFTADDFQIYGYIDTNKIVGALTNGEETGPLVTLTYSFGTIGIPVYDKNLIVHMGNMKSNSINDPFLKRSAMSGDMCDAAALYKSLHPEIETLSYDGLDIDAIVDIGVNTEIYHLMTDDVDLVLVDGARYLVMSRRLVETCVKYVFGIIPDLTQYKGYDPKDPMVIYVPLMRWEDGYWPDCCYTCVRTEDGYVMTVEVEGHPEAGHTIYFDSSFCMTLIVYNDYVPAVPGDIDGDGALTMKDLLTLRAMIAGTAPFDDETAARADINGDGTVNMKDVLALRKLLAGAE